MRITYSMEAEEQQKEIQVCILHDTYDGYALGSLLILGDKDGDIEGS